MTYMEFENLRLRADNLSANCDPRKAGYWKGYLSGIEFHFNNPAPDSGFESFLIVDEDTRRRGVAYVSAFTRGYGDGCKGLPPEDTRP